MLNFKRLFALSSLLSVSAFSQNSGPQPQILAHCTVENILKETRSCKLTMDDFATPFENIETPLLKDCALNSFTKIRLQGIRVQDSVGGIADTNPKSEDLKPSFKELKVSLIPTELYLEENPRINSFFKLNLAVTPTADSSKSIVSRKTIVTNIPSNDGSFAAPIKLSCLFLN